MKKCADGGMTRARKSKVSPVTGREYAARPTPAPAQRPMTARPSPAMLGEGRIRDAGNAVSGRKRQIDDAVDRMAGYANGGVVKRNGKYC